MNLIFFDINRNHYDHNFHAIKSKLQMGTSNKLLTSHWQLKDFCYYQNHNPKHYYAFGFYSLTELFDKIMKYL